MKIKAKSFHFCGYNFNKDNKKITFHYKIEFLNKNSLKFKETIYLKKIPNNKKEVTKKILESLELILGISYYKLYLPPKIFLSSNLSKSQANFWNVVYKKGLGEFLYTNKLDPNQIAKFPYSKVENKPIELKTTNRVLLGMGNGKDSIVAAKLLKDFSCSLFSIETQKNNINTKIINKKLNLGLIKIKRELDPKIFQKHKDSYNGHIPISAIYAFLGLLLATIYDYKYVVVANEYSSNFGNLKYKNETINHQWSKSEEFELLLQNYINNFISPDLRYFSVLRQFYEIRIAQIFSKYKEFFPYFTSCNNNFKIQNKITNKLWCTKCPKCVFVFCILSPFLSKQELKSIFNKNLYKDEKLIPLFSEILGFSKIKPFDCVGTFSESRAALVLASKKYKNDIIIKTFLKKIKSPQKNINEIFKTHKTQNTPTPFRFLGAKNICILGYGKEGEVNKKYINKFYPDLKVKILDKKRDKNYLKKIENHDLAIKTPGINKEKVNIPYLTATNIFFSQCKNLTIGITGTKGKSTTASLIYHILKSAGKKVRLLGNIGSPMLEALLTKIDPNEIFVIELSSYMLDDIEYSPNIAVLLNKFPDHMDYHGNIQNYYLAKDNIFKFQKKDDIAIKPPFNEKINLNTNSIPLLGKHNLQNIKAAIKVCKLLNIPEDKINQAIENFKPLKHRLEYIGKYNDIFFYDDAISTTPESTIMAIKTLKNVDTIFLGGQDRGYNFNKLEKEIKKFNISNIVLFSDNNIIKNTKKFNILKTKSMEDAVKFAFKKTKKNKACLLSTASPSYSIWKNYEEKGNKFQKFIKKHRN